MIPVRIPHVLLAALTSFSLCVCVAQGPVLENKQKVQCVQRWPVYGCATELNQQKQIHQEPNRCADDETVRADDDSPDGADEDTVGSPVTTGEDTTRTDDVDSIKVVDRKTVEFPPAPPLVCEKDNGFEPPQNLRHFMTSLLHERDVTHYLTSSGYYSLLGDGAYANVHLGKYMPTGECVVIKRFTDSSIRVTESEIRMHRYIEQFLPNVPRLLGVVPIGHYFYNLSVVYQLVPEGHTFYDWLDVADAFSPVQWLSVVLQLAENLEILHRKCVLHNDLHSANVMLHFHDGGRYSADCGMSKLERAEDDEKVEKMARSLAKVKVKGTTLPTVTFIDFGFATFREGKVYHSSPESLASSLHLAPELLQHAETTPASDVFSLGHEIQYVAEALNSSALFDIAARCTKPDPRSRPSVGWLVNSLRKLFLHELRRTVHDYDHGVQKQSRKHPDEELSAPVHDSFVLSSSESLLWSSVRKRPVLQKRAKSLPERNVAETFDGHCFPEQFEVAVSKLNLPYITYTNGDLVFQLANGKSKIIFFESNYTSIDIGVFVSREEKVVIKQLKNKDDYSTVRYEAMMNLFLHESGWVPCFYGVVPTDKYYLENLGIVQEFFAKGVTLDEVLEERKPFGVIPRVRLALQLTSLMRDVHSRHMLINNFSKYNILCACMNDSHCLDIKLIDLGKAGGCEGRVFRGDMSNPFYSQLAPEVRHNGMTSFASDIFSLCVILNIVLERQALLRDTTRESRGEVEQFLSKWVGISKFCSSRDPSLRPSLFQLRHFFATFVSSR